MSTKYVYHFAKMSAEGDSNMPQILGGKGANLAGMCRLGLPIPPGFTISCMVCRLYRESDFQLPQKISLQIKDSIKTLESLTGKTFGCQENPLLFSVRSGSRFSMPGMLDTVLNIGLNDIIVKNHQNKFMLDSYRRLIQMYGDVVLKIESYHFEEYLYSYKQGKGIVVDSELSVDDLKIVIESFKSIVKRVAGQDFPQDVYQQVFKSICAVFDSWDNERAKTYRGINGISDDTGTAVNVQSMVFGNFNDNSASGVLFTRNPSTGENKIFGEYIQNAQGEDIVSGARTPKDIFQMETDFGDAYKDLIKIGSFLEDNYKDIQDIEFTIEDGKLYILQTRSAKRSAAAAIKVAVNMVSEGRITKEEAILRVQPESIECLLHPRISDEDEKLNIVGRGLPASPGAASGIAIFSTEEAVKRSQQGEKIVLIKNETSPEDIAGMNAAVAVVTTRGGMTSHAAVVARGMGKPCICALSNSILDQHSQVLTIGKDIKINKEDIVTVDGATGRLISGNVKTSEFNFSDEFNTFMGWVDSIRKIGVRANAETKDDIAIAQKFGADGIGLCRTEHMFFSQDRINIVRSMIMAEDAKSRNEALEKLLPIQTEDFLLIFKSMDTKPTTIRLLDPPLHEFLPSDSLSFENFREYSGLSSAFIERRIKALKEENPMLGHRGCRLAISHPEIYKMQVNAIFSAAKIAKVKPEIMIPFIMNAKELEIIKEMIENIAEFHGVRYSLGNMIELPSAALLADEIAIHSEFFSFGTNDLTQTTLGISRDDCNKFLSLYKEQGILKHDPFTSICQENVGKLVIKALKAGRNSNPEIKIGVCGEHGGDPKSIEFFVEIGADYVSCSPYRIPIAKLAAAQCEIKINNQNQM